MDTPPSTPPPPSPPPPPSQPSPPSPLPTPPPPPPPPPTTPSPSLPLPLPPPLSSPLPSPLPPPPPTPLPLLPLPLPPPSSLPLPLPPLLLLPLPTPPSPPPPPSQPSPLSPTPPPPPTPPSSPLPLPLPLPSPLPSPSSLPPPPPSPPSPPLHIDLEGQQIEQEVEDLSTRAQPLRAALLGAFEGLLASVGAVTAAGVTQKDSMSMITAGVGAFISGITMSSYGEFMSVSSQRGIELAQIERDHRTHRLGAAELATRRARLPSPLRAAGASMLARSVGIAAVVIPLLFVNDSTWWMRLLIGVVTIASALFVGPTMKLGKATAMKMILQAIVGAWLVMTILYLYTRLTSGGFS